MATSKKGKPTMGDIEGIIQKAVDAGRIAAGRRPKDIYKATERRLYAYSVIKIKIADEREWLNDIIAFGAPEMSKSIVRHLKHGMRLTSEEITEIQIQDMNAQIASNEHEIETIDKALTVIEGDPYEHIIKYKYFEGKNDDEIAGILSCDPSTVRRNKSRLTARLAVYLYGVAAVV